MDFKEARQRVSIVQIAEHLGYAYNKAKGRIRPQYEHPNGDKIDRKAHVWTPVT